MILHSDRSSQFRSDDCQHFLKRNMLVYSMNAVGHYDDNIACERFFRMLKREHVSTEENTGCWL